MFIKLTDQLTKRKIRLLMNAFRNLFLLLLLFAGHSTILGDNPTDYTERSYIDLLPLAEEGDPLAQAALGVMYYHGQGVQQDFKKARKWFQLAAKQKHSQAQFILGLMYAKGDGVKQNDKEASKWYQLAANQGFAEAQFLLGLNYHDGQGVKQNFKEAADWFRLAAEQGIASSQFRLGLMYAKGAGIPQDSVKAHKWFSIAGSQGHQDANQLKSQLERQMTPSQIEKSQQLINQWKPLKKGS